MGSTAGQFLINSTKPETFMLTAEQQAALPVESKMALEQVDDLKYFLATAPANWQVDQIIRRYLLPTGEYVSCVLWHNLFHISGTDIVRALTYRFQAFGRPVRNIKKFEEGVFSDLRNLKNGTDASLEEPKSGFLDLLYKNNCIRTQKKQKVFYWFSVPHDRLFLDALERDLKRERMGTESTTAAVAEPALSFVFDATQSLFEQLTKTLQHNAASEVGASLAAQQAQNNMMAAQYGSLGNGNLAVPFSMSRRASLGGAPAQPTAHYYARSQSIQSTVPLDYHVRPAGRGATASEPGQALRSTSGAMDFQPGHAHSLSSPTMFHNPFAADTAAQEVTEDADAAFRREYSFDETIGFAMPRVSSGISQEELEKPSGFEEDTPLSPGQVSTSVAQQEIPVLEDFSYDASADPINMLPTYAIPFAPRPSFGLNFNMFEGSPTYKQRRRRQSIPSSVLMQEQAQLQQRAQERDARRARDVSTTTSQQELTDVTDTEILSSVDQFSEVGGDLGYMQELQAGGMEELGYGLHHLQQAHSAPPGSSNGSSGSRPVSRDGSEYENVYAINNPHGQPYPQARQFPCPKPGCGRGFRRLEHLKRHVRTHTHERPFLCPVCFKKFSRSDNLAQHRRTHERGFPGSGASSPAASLVDIMEHAEGHGAGVPMQRAATFSGMGHRYNGNNGYSAPTSHGYTLDQHQQQFFGNGQMVGFEIDEAGLQGFQQDAATSEMIKALSMPGYASNSAHLSSSYFGSGYYGVDGASQGGGEMQMPISNEEMNEMYLPLTPRATKSTGSPQDARRGEMIPQMDETGDVTPRVAGSFASRAALQS